MREEIHKGCPNCPWKDRKTQTVPSEGPSDSPLMVIGRNPGRTEDTMGIPFIGPAGKYLDLFFADTGILRGKIYITNTAKCYGGAGDPCPTEDVFNCCEGFLKREMEIVKPTLIMPFGVDAYRRVTGDVAPITVIQGQIAEFRHLPGKKFFPMTHPSMWARTPSYYDSKILKDIVPEFLATLRNLGIFDRLT